MSNHLEAAMRPHVPSYALPLLLIASLIAGAVDAAGAPTHLWSKGFGSANGGEYGRSLATDPSGGTAIVGSFSGNTNFGGGVLVNAGASDIFLARYDTNGNHLWSRRFGSTGFDVGNAVATDVLGNVYATGFFQGTVDFGGGGLVATGTNDIFFVKYSAGGSHVWSKRFGTVDAANGWSIAVDPFGNAFLTGVYNGTINFGGANLVSNSFDVCFAKFDPSGAHLQSINYGGAGFDVGLDLAVDSFGNLYATGSFSGTASLGGSSLVSAGFDDVFLAKYDGSLNHQWSQRFGGTSSDSGRALVVNDGGEVWLAASFNGTANFGDGPLAGTNDIALAKYSPTGAHIWSKRFGGGGSDYPYGLAIDTADRIFLTGSHQGGTDFGGGILASVGLDDIYLAVFSGNGQHAWSATYGVSFNDVGYGVGIDLAGDVALTGSFTSSVNFGGGTLTSAGNDDIFLAKLGDPGLKPVITSIIDIGNDQGRQVKIRFTRSSLDGPTTRPITQYEAYRRDDPTPSFTTQSGANPAAARPMAAGWTQVGTVAAHGETEYGIDVPTVGDSTVVLGQYYSVFYIRAATATSTSFFDSPIDSGYSRDNLAPGIPDNLVYDAGDLAWDESKAEDFDFFTVYGSNTDSFGAATVVNYSVAPGVDVTASPYVFYFVTATDFSGNEGKPARVNTLSGVGGAPRSYVLSVANYPNPFNPRTTVSYTVPSSGAVRVAVYDLRGTHVATLFEGERSSGAYSVDWDGRDQSGAPVSSGVYFARIEQNGATRTKKMVLLK